MVGGDECNEGRDGVDIVRDNTSPSIGKCLVSVRDALLRVGDERLLESPPCDSSKDNQSLEVLEQYPDISHYPFPRFPSLNANHKRNAKKRRSRDKQVILHQLTTSTTRMESTFSCFPVWQQPIDEVRRRKRQLKQLKLRLQNESERTHAEGRPSDSCNDDSSDRGVGSSFGDARNVAVPQGYDSEGCAASHEEGYSSEGSRAETE